MGECFLHHFNSSLRKLVSQAAQELFIADVAIAIDVVVLHQSLELNLLEEESEGTEALLEFCNIKSLISIKIHLDENSPEGPNAYSSLLLNSPLESQIELSNKHVYERQYYEIMGNNLPN
jgi:hypothetical protein